MPGPDPGPFDAVDAGSVPAVAAFEGADSTFASGSPFDGAPKGWSVFLGLSRLGGSALSGDDDGAHAEVVQGAIDVLLAVVAIGGHGPRWTAGACADAVDRWG